MARVMRRVVDDVDMREAHSPYQEAAEQSGKDSPDERVRSGGGP